MSHLSFPFQLVTYENKSLSLIACVTGGGAGASPYSRSVAILA